MDRVHVLWLVGIALVLVAAPLFFANAFASQMAGYTEEVALVLILAAAVLALVGVALRRGRGWDAKAAACVAVVLVISPLAWAATFAMLAPDFDAHRTPCWERLAETPADAPVIDPARVPPAVLDAMRATAPGARGCVTIPTAEYAPFYDHVLTRAPDRVAVADGIPFRFEPSAV